MVGWHQMKHAVLRSFEQAPSQACKDKKKGKKPTPNNWIFSNQTDNIYSLRVVPRYFRKCLNSSE